jgi:hypothetical protein
MMVRFDEEDSRGALVSVRDGDGNQQLLLQNEYLLAENTILRAHLPSRLLLTGPARSTLGRDRPTTWPPNQTQFWPGFASWSLRSSMTPTTASIRVDRS